MKPITLLIVLLAFSACASSEEKYTISQVQGAWWSGLQNATADFLIQGNEVWLDLDAKFHPCKINGDILTFYISDEIGAVKNRIISVLDDRLVLENLSTHIVTEYTRER